MAQTCQVVPTVLSRFALLACAALVLWLGACTKSRSPSVGGEANWLRPCSADQPCAVGSCLCGVCTQACELLAGCSGDFAGICADSSGTLGALLCEH